MKFKRYFSLKRTTILCLLLCLAFSITGCGKNYEKTYQSYTKSLIAINYLGATKDFIDATGANQEDADALYDSNIKLLANNIQTYYNVTISDAPALQTEYENLARNIYSKVNYKVSKAYKGSNSYYVDITIYPIDLFNQTSSEVSAYIDEFNLAVSNGDYNDKTFEQYETDFSTGLIKILNDGCLEMTYADPVTVTVEIIHDGDTFYISDSDFLAIDRAMINASVQYNNVSEEEQTETTETSEE